MENSIDHISVQALQDELRRTQAVLEETRFKLDDANDTLEAIRSGEVDALVVKREGDHQIFTLKTADLTYRIFIEQLTEGVATLNKHGDILYCNSSFANLLQMPLQKIIGQSFLAHITEDNRDACTQLLAMGWINSSRGEVTVHSMSGSPIPVVLACKRLDLETNVSLSIVITDLSAQKAQQALLMEKNSLLEEAEQVARFLNTNLEILVQQRTIELERLIEEKVIISAQLFNNQERLTKILETMAEGVIIMNAKGDIVYANRTAQLMLELAEAAEHDHPIYKTNWQYVSITGTPLQAREHPVYLAMERNELIYDAEIAIDLPGRNRTYLAFNAVPLEEESGAITGAVGTFMNITQRRILLQQKDDFIGVASHELKTPITSLKVSLQLLDRLKQEPQNNMVPKLIEQANRGLDRLTRLVEDLLDVTKLREGQLSLQKKSFRLRQLIEDSTEHLLLLHKVQIIVEGNDLAEVHADPVRMQQVMTNFLNNALKYAPSSKQIQIKVDDAFENVKISVTDQGPGISPEKQAYLFDRYFRTDHSGAQNAGLGLGLYISAEIIKKHGGTIGVESIVGGGSTFWFTLPK